MKKLFALLSIVLVAFYFSSCYKQDLAMPRNQVQFTELKADSYTIPVGDSTLVNALVENICGEMTFEWNASEGKLHGSKTSMVFNAETPGDAVITCTVNHPGKASVTKSITIVVE